MRGSAGSIGSPKIASRPLTLTTPLGPDVLVPTALSGREALSELFRFHLDVVAENRRDVPFDALLGHPVGVRLSPPAGGPVRHFSGICSRISQGDRDARHTAYELEVVPSFWLLTRTAGSRAFQTLSVPEILERTLGDQAARLELRTPLHRHEYVVQYRETDFAFAGRLMEEEGIFYFFEHGDGAHALVLADSPESHPDLPPVRYDVRGAAGTVYSWEKRQELRAGKVTLRDHHFQLPGASLEGAATIQESVAAGRVAHRLRLPASEALELYDFPGEYGPASTGSPRTAATSPASSRRSSRTSAARPRAGWRPRPRRRSRSPAPRPSRR